MAGAAIPVDLSNPGQVFASLGFLEVASVLCGNAEGGFDWTAPSNIQFGLSANGERNPFEVVLEFLSSADVKQLAPLGYEDAGSDVVSSVTFPASVDPANIKSIKKWKTKLPILLDNGAHRIELTHWCNESFRSELRLKLYAGNRSAAQIARAMLKGSSGTVGVRALWKSHRMELTAQPFEVLTSMGGSFNFDARGGWTGIDAGYSLNDQKHAVAASPIVEILAPVGLENARPRRLASGRYRYRVWGKPLPVPLARAAIGGGLRGVRSRSFQFELRPSGRNKIVTFAEEEVSW